MRTVVVSESSESDFEILIQHVGNIYHRGGKAREAHVFLTALVDRYAHCAASSWRGTAGWVKGEFGKGRAGQRARY